MSHVFVSYSRKDQVIVSAIVREIERNAIKVWIDRKDIAVGSTWDNTIDFAIKEASSILLFFSESSANSKYVLNELNYAENIGKKIIIVVLDDADMLWRLQRIQHIDLRQNFEQGLAKLILVLGSEIQKQEPRLNTNPTAQLESITGSIARNLDNEKTPHPGIQTPEDSPGYDDAGRAFFPLVQFLSQQFELLRVWEVRYNITSIGRISFSDVGIDSQSISRYHVRILKMEDGYFLENLSPTNGTFLIQDDKESERLPNHERTRLYNGMTFSLAHVVLIRIQIDEADSDGVSTDKLPGLSEMPDEQE